MGSNHQLALGDYDGDGWTDRAIVSARGEWYILTSSGIDSSRLGIPWGWNWGVALNANQRLAVGDYDGDGRSDRALAVRDRSTGEWQLWALGSILGSAGHSWRFPDFGFSLDKVAVGDYDGDGSADPALQNAASGEIAYLTVW